ncbi:hypothetical protein P9112_002145 [Eukaryota sp. TZLM1-RC]
MSKASTALIRAEELVSCDQPDLALQQLNDTVNETRKYSPDLERCVIFLVDLAVRLHKPKQLREGLNRLRFVCGSPYMQDAIRSYGLAHTFAPFENAVKHSLSAISTVDADHSTILDLYRTCFDVLRYSSTSVSSLYVAVATEAFSFCLTHKRVAEFKQLSDLLRNQLKFLLSDEEAINDKEVIIHHVNTRFELLETATKLEQWQEAKRTIGDISKLLNVTKHLSLLTTEAQRRFLSQVCLLFWVSKSFRYFSILGCQLIDLTSDPVELKQLSNDVVAATVCSLLNVVPDFSNRSRDTTLSESLGIVIKAPIGYAEDHVFVDVIRSKINKYASQEFIELFRVVSEPNDVDVSKMWSKCKTAVDATSISAEVKSIIWISIFDRLSKSFSSLTFNQLSQYLGVNSAMLPMELMLFMGKNNLNSLSYLPRVDLAFQQVIFVKNPLVSAKLAACANTIAQIDAISSKICLKSKLESHAKICESVRETIETEHRNCIERRRVINHKQQQIEKINQSKQQRLQNQEAERQLQRQKEEEERVAEEQARREKDKEAKRIAHEQSLEEKRREQQRLLIEKRKKEEQRSRMLDKLNRRADYYERAVRREEIPLRKQAQAEIAKEAQDKYEKYVEEATIAHKNNWEVAIKEKHRLLPVFDLANQLLESIREEQKEAGLIAEIDQDHEVSAVEGNIDMDAAAKNQADAQRALEERKRKQEEERKAEERREQDEYNASLIEKLDKGEADRQAAGVLEMLSKRKAAREPTPQAAPVVSRVTEVISVTGPDQTRLEAVEVGEVDEQEAEKNRRLLMEKMQNKQKKTEVVLPASSTESIAKPSQEVREVGEVDESEAEKNRRLAMEKLASRKKHVVATASTSVIPPQRPSFDKTEATRQKEDVEQKMSERMSRTTPAAGLSAQDDVLARYEQRKARAGKEQKAEPAEVQPQTSHDDDVMTRFKKRKSMKKEQLKQQDDWRHV